MNSTDPAEAVVAVITSEATTYKVVLPDPDDYIQKRLLDTGAPYEQSMLRAMAGYLSPGDVVLDIGANVGNHTLFLSSVAGCRVVAFEPDAHLATAITASAELNGTADLVTVMQMGLADAPGAGHLVGAPVGNIGGQRIERGGDVELARLDDLDLPRPVRAVKIDVEGMEPAVLAGGQSLIDSDHPVAFVEAGTDAEFAKIAEWFADRGYVYWETYNATPTHLFIHRGALTAEEVANRLLVKTMRDGFRATDEMRRLRSTLDSANLKYRESTRAVDDARTQLEETRSSLVAAHATVERMSAEADRARERSAHLEQQLDALRAKHDERTDRLIELSAIEARLQAKLEASAALTSAYSELGGQFDDLKRVVIQCDDKQEALRSELAAAAADFADARATEERLREQVHTLRAALADATAKTRRVRKKRDLARRKVSVLEGRVAALEAEIAELTPLRDRCRELSAELEGAQDRRIHAEREMGTARRRITQLEQDAARLATEVQDARAESAELAADLALARDQGARAQDQIAAVEARTAAELAIAREEAARAQKRFVEAEANAAAADSEVAAVRASISFRAGRELQRATRSPKAALMLPLSLWRLRRAHPGPFAVIEAAPPAREIGTPTESGAATVGTAGDDASEVASDSAPTPRLRIAAIVDEFTAHSLAPDCELHNIKRESWEGDLEAAKPELLFVESAWRGAEGSWHNAVQHLGPELQGILAWCKAHGVPTVFWNKEDPVHFSTFITAAGAFDHVFTTDIDCIGRYKAALGHNNVHLMPFAAQPAVHNPIDLEGGRKDAICFAGSYYRRYPDRTRNLDDFLAELPKFREVEIFDRNFGSDDPNYSFPEEYKKYIVGTLPPEQISRAYKGYRFAINLNSVKQSQTMFARRVFELLGSGTLTVSNFSRGVRLLFGDLVITTDSGAEAVRRLSGLSEDDVDRLRLLGLRKVMQEHTYADRLALIAHHALGTEGTARLPRLLMVGRATTETDLRRLLAAMDRQNGVVRRGVIVTDVRSAVPLPEGVTTLPVHEANVLRIDAIAEPDEFVATLSPDDHYGASYLVDLLLATRYSSADAIGKASRFTAAGPGQSALLSNPGREYVYVEALAARSAIVKASAIGNSLLSDVAEPTRVLRTAQNLAVDRFNYCEYGESAATETTAIDDLQLDSGLSLEELSALADDVPASDVSRGTAPVIGGSKLHEWFGERHRPLLTHALDGAAWKITSDLEEGVHDYLYAAAPIPISAFWSDPSASAYIDATPGLNIQLVFIFKDEAGERLGAFHLPSLRNGRTSVPEGTTHVVLALRALGPGEATIHALMLDEYVSEPAVIPHRQRHLVLTNHYPSYENLYRNGFVHSRVRSYRDVTPDGFDVFRLDERASLSFAEFEDVDVLSGTSASLATYLRTTTPASVLVHFLDEPMWKAIIESGYRGPIVVWLHGAEVQPWWRRAYNYSTEAELEAAKPASDARLAFWQSVFTTHPDNVRFVFVSQYFADEVMEDVGVTLDPDRYSIIHNPIDTEIFRYTPKSPEQRHKILSIRPFASAKYANDLSVAAVLDLADEPWFNELTFHFIGDGPLFEATLEPLKDLPNVMLERRFLTQNEIAELHREYGVFLVPTRMDAQGVSRDEAMSSGLVPITNAVAAIPEFVDDTCGLLARGDDASGLAEAIRRLHHDPALFTSLSASASARVARQSAASIIRRAELALFAPPSGRKVADS